MQDLSAKLKEKLAACSTIEEIASVIDEEGIELTSEQLGSVAGGVEGLNIGGTCPVCGHDSLVYFRGLAWRCLHCGAKGDPIIDLDPLDPSGPLGPLGPLGPRTSN